MLAQRAWPEGACPRPPCAGTVICASTAWRTWPRLHAAAVPCVTPARPGCAVAGPALPQHSARHVIRCVLGSRATCLQPLCNAVVQKGLTSHAEDAAHLSPLACLVRVICQPAQHGPMLHRAAPVQQRDDTVLTALHALHMNTFHDTETVALLSARVVLLRPIECQV